MMSDPLAVSSSLVEASPASNVSGRVGGSAPVGESEGDGASTQSDLASRAALKAKEEEVMNLLRSERVPYDKYHALVLVEVHNFKAGQLYLYERLARGDSSNNELGGVVPSLLLEHYAERADVPAMLRMCRREPDLWAKVLGLGSEADPATTEDQMFDMIDKTCGKGGRPVPFRGAYELAPPSSGVATMTVTHGGVRAAA